MTVLALYPRGDYAAERVATWGEASMGDRQCELLDGSEVNLDDIRTKLAACNASVICYFGHGKDDRWIANNAGTMRTVIESTGCDDIQGVRVIAVACLSAKHLGPAMNANGCDFLGFVEKIFWYPNLSRCEKAIGEAIAQVVNRILDDPNADEAVLRAPIREKIDYFRNLASRDDREANSTAVALENLASGIRLL